MRNGRQSASPQGVHDRRLLIQPLDRLMQLDRTSLSRAMPSSRIWHDHGLRDVARPWRPADAKTSGPICASVTRAVRAIWKPDVNARLHRSGLERWPSLSHYWTKRRADGKDGLPPSQWPNSLSFDVVSRATVIEIAGSLINSATFRSNETHDSSDEVLNLLTRPRADHLQFALVHCNTHTVWQNW